MMLLWLLISEADKITYVAKAKSSHFGFLNDSKILMLWYGTFFQLFFWSANFLIKKLTTI